MKSNVLASGLAVVLGLAGVGAIGLVELTIAPVDAAVGRLKKTEIKIQQDYKKQLEDLQKALILYKQQGSKEKEVETIGKIANTYFKLEKPKESERVIRENLNLFRTKKDNDSEKFLILVLRQYLLENWTFSAGFGWVADIEIQDRYRLGTISWGSVLDFSNFNLFVSRLVVDREQEIASLHGIGWTYRNLGNFYDAQTYYLKALELAKSEKSVAYTSFLYVEIGVVYSDIGLYQKALENFQVSLSISSTLSKPEGHLPYPFHKENLKHFASTKMGMAYISLEEYDNAFIYLRKASEKSNGIDIHNSFSGLGLIYDFQGKQGLALRAYEDALLSITVGDPSAKGEILNRIGLLYVKQGEYAKALDYFQQSLTISRELQSSPGESIALSNIALLLEKQNQSELAITFYKESVRVTESIRKNLRRMTIAEQKAYTESISKTYRSLANLLLSQGRVLEAQQILELLKIQELRDFMKDTRFGGDNDGTLLNPVEQPIPAAFSDKIAIGNQLTKCEQTKCADRPQLIAQRDTANTKFIALVDRLKKLLTQQQSQDPAQLQTSEFTRAAQDVILANPKTKTVLIYPLVLDDKLWLVWGAKAGKGAVVFDSKEISVKRKDLSAKVAELQTLLKNPNSNPKDLQRISQQLYQWLLQPIRKQLDDNGIQNIVFSLDRATRYIPMATLHDGQQYLIENFSISTILTAKTDTQDKLSQNLLDDPILGLGLTQGISGFAPLPAVQTELDGIIKTNGPGDKKGGIYPGVKLFDRDFTETALRNNIADHRILHIATHGSFVPGNPEDSFLVLGDGKKLSISTIQSMTALANTHLVVLSACETGKGGVDKEGIEVAGIGHYFLLSGAKSVMASLWLVNDPATSLLMREFYSKLSQGNLTKAEALRQVQIAFLKETLTNKDAEALDRAGGRRFLEGQLPVNSFAHPYYWAPFILIGNSQ